MSLSTCIKCGGHIPLGPDASNRCENCGAGVFPDQPPDGVVVSAEALRKAREALLIARTANLPECEREVIAEAMRLLYPPTEDVKP